jgi:serine protease Do
VLGRFELPDTVAGLVITDVQGDTSAYEEGIRPGDVLSEVSQEKVKTPSDALHLLEAAKNEGKKSVLLLIESQSGFRFVAVKLR